jgi:polyferredoxin
MAEVKRRSRRQATRRAVIFVAFLLFPVVLNFLSPYVIIDGAANGIINGSFVLFGLLFVSALFLGRLWCAWACPGAGMQEACFMINDKPARGGRLNWIKWGIWFPWLGAIALAAISAGGYKSVNLLYLTESGISVDEPAKYVIYYVVVGLVFVLALTTGRRGFCHYGCWMAPFLIIGRQIRNALNTPALRLQADADKCIECGRCTKGCPMSLAVQQMVLASAMENSECILCGSCVDICPKQAIRYTFSAGK